MKTIFIVLLASSLILLAATNQVQKASNKVESLPKLLQTNAPPSVDQLRVQAFIDGVQTALLLKARNIDDTDQEIMSKASQAWQRREAAAKK